MKHSHRVVLVALQAGMWIDIPRYGNWTYTLKQGRKVVRNIFAGTIRDMRKLGLLTNQLEAAEKRGDA